MSNVPNNQESLLAGREVPPTFGAKQVSTDPIWEREFSSWLKETTSLSRLQELFAVHRSGEDSLSVLMRRVLMRTMCRAAGESLLVGPDVVLKHPETMEFGNYIFIGAQAMIQGRFDGTCRIGNHVWIGPQAYFDARNLVLEDYVGWGPGAKVLGSVHSGQPSSVPTIKTSLIIKPVRICYGADIGMNASILPGVRIGQQAIVGAGAVVTLDVPDYAVVAGVPARVLYLRDRA
jgi:acetyltransferase-like isoleucine patch superfamily enzyme